MSQRERSQRERGRSCWAQEPTRADRAAPARSVRGAGTVTSRAMRSRRGTVAANVTALVVFVLFVFPVYWMVTTAFKPAGDIRTSTSR